MEKIISKIGISIASGALIAGAIAPAAFAQGAVTVSNNGRNSHTTVHVTNTTGCTLSQVNVTTVTTTVHSTANSGKNKSNDNIGGGASIASGPAHSTVSTTVTGGSNTATDPCCPCNLVGDLAGLGGDVTVDHNGRNSTNNVTVTNNNTTTVGQGNTTTVTTTVNSSANSGQNTANDNIGEGGTTITTDNANSTVTTTVNGSSNTLNTL